MHDHGIRQDRHGEASGLRSACGAVNNLNILENDTLLTVIPEARRRG